MKTIPQYFIYDDLVTLRDRYAGLDTQARAALKSHVALNCADPRAAALFADIAGDDWAHIYPSQERPEPISTNDAIQTFLETYGHASPEEDALLERLIFNPTPDYTGVLEAEAKESPSDSPHDLTSQRIDSFIASHPAGPVSSLHHTATAATPRDNSVPSTPVDDTTPTHGETAAPLTPEKPEATAAKKDSHIGPAPSSLSESLAKIYIKQGKYERAYEIISDLNLKNPEKSIYFADQLRFLRKLMLLSSQKK